MRTKVCAARGSTSHQSIGESLIVGIIVTVACFLAVGCTGIRQWAHQGFKVGPDYCTPPAPVADRWIDYANTDISSEAMEDAYWWNVFNDPQLNELIQRASQQNLTLRSAGMRILQTRANLAITRGNLFPQTQRAYGDYARFNTSSTNANVVPQVDFDLWGTGFEAGWELDFWGRFRRAIERDEAFLNASIERYDNVLVVLQAEVASAYIQYRTLQERLALAQRNVELQRRTFEMADVKRREEQVSELDVAQAGENLAFTESAIPALEQAIRETGNAICVLLGEPPRDLTEELGDGPIPQIPDQIFAGIPAELLRRRPDVRRAERLAAAQCATIGIAESDFYPQFSVNGYIGVESEDLSDLFDSRSVIGAIGPSFRWNLLNYGRILNNVRRSEASFYQLVIDYQNTVLNANREVEDGIIAFLKERQRVDSLDTSATQARRAVDISSLQYREGQINFQPVVYMQQILADRQDQLATSRGNAANAVVLIYKSLGGGWRARMTGGPLVNNPGMIMDAEDVVIPGDSVLSPMLDEAMVEDASPPVGPPVEELKPVEVR